MLEKGVKMKNKAVLLAFVLMFLPTTLSLCSLGLLELQIAYASPYTNISAGTAYDMITSGLYPDLVVLDVRTQEEYDGGHIYGAVWIPFNELPARINELAGHENHEIIVYCLAGSRSATASGTLDSNGFTKVYNMLGGITAWESAGYPVWIATVHNIDTAFNYDTIQAAIDAPQTLDEHTILVDAGVYYEHVVVKKSLSLIGEGRSTAIIDGNWTVGNGINVTANNVTISGFTVKNNWKGIYVDGASDNIIKENFVTNSTHGILLEGSSNNTVVENILLNNTYGIYIISSSVDNEVYHNSFINNTNQAFLESSTSSAQWDNGYEGNYWSDYDGTDVDGDGIGDTEIPHLDLDYYPLIYSYGSIRNLNTDLVYLTIQSAINAPQTLDTHTILLSSGTYCENIVVNKSVSLVGENRINTLINGSNTGHTISITANNVTVSEFTIQNGGGLTDANIYLEYSNHSKVINNIFTRDELYGDYGVRLNFSSFNTISGNTITKKMGGICLDGSFHNIISGNNITANRDYGIKLGITEKSSYNTIFGNTITNHVDGTIPCGINLDWLSSNNTVFGNKIANNEYGIFLEYSSNNSIYGNEIANNNQSIHLWSSSDNIIYHNEFVDNTEQVYSSESTNTWDSGKEEGNYWSDYDGTDTNGDGIGDTNLPWQGVDYYPLVNPYVAGDANHDGYVNVVDLGLLSDAWLTESGEPDYNPHVDFNMDDFANILDLGIMSDHWLQSSI